MFRLVVTEAAHDDLDEAFAYIATVLENPTAAIAMVVEKGVSGGKTVAPRVHAILASIFGEAEP